MDKSKMMAELESNCKANTEQLRELFEAYDLAVLGYDMQKQREEEIHNAVLADNCFYAEKDCKRFGIKAGDRITEEDCTFLLSKNDFEHFCDLSTELLAKEGITDKNGYYITDWLGIKGDTRRKLVGFIVANIIPEGLKPQFEGVGRHLIHSEKLIDITRPMIKKAA